jgi:DNA-directed RNA polymerase subunit D
MAEVPTLAVEDVEFRNNSSALYDEIIAHRLGLIPIKTDLKSYDVQSECKCEGEGCSRCQLKMVLKTGKRGVVFASDVESQDPTCRVVFDDMPLVKLLAKQRVDLEAVAVLGRGKEHMKWSPGHLFFRGVPELDVPKSVDVDDVLKSVGDHVKKASGGLKVVDVHGWDEAVEDKLESAGVVVNNSLNDFLVTFESWGQLSCSEALEKAADVIVDKLDELAEKISV